MTTNADLADLERHLRETDWRRLNRRDFCKALGISQGRLRRQLDLGPSASVPRTLALAMAAIATGLEPFVHGSLSREGGGASAKGSDGDQEHVRSAAG